MADIFGALQSGWNMGQQMGEQKRQRTLADLLGKAATSSGPQRQQYVAQAYGQDPGVAMQAERAFGQQEDERAGRLREKARLLASLPPQMRPQAYASIVPELQQMGLGDGIPPQWSDDLLPTVEAIANSGQQSQVPAGYREFEMMAKAGGLEGDARQRAARIALGMDPRASSAAIKYMEVEGADGRTRIVAMDPRDVGAQVIGGGEMYGSGVAPTQGGDPFGFLTQAGATVTSGQRSPEHNARVGGVPNSYHLSGQARDILPPQSAEQAAFIRQQAAAQGLEVIDEGDHWHLEPARRPQQGGVSPFVGRRKEDEAYATELAKGAAGLQLAPAQAQADAQREGMVTAAREQAQSQAEIAANAPKAVAKADETIALLDAALGHPGRETVTGMSGIVDPRNYMRGTDAKDFRVLLKQLGGRAFLEAFESLKGGGQITQIEGEKATEAMARLSDAQSDEAFAAALRELREIAMKAKTRAETQLGGRPPAGNGSDPLGILD